MNKQFYYITLIVSFISAYTNCRAQFIAQQSGTTQTLWSTVNLSNDTAVVVGNNGTIIYTNNNGINWDTASKPSSVTQGLRDVQFINNTVGFAVGTSGRIIKTFNRGITWSILSSPTTSGLLAVNFINDTLGFIAGGGSGGNGIWRTIDSGGTWSFINTISSTFDIQFSQSKQFGVACGVSGMVAITTNGGFSWTVSNPLTGTLNAISIINDSVAYIVGQNGLIARTINQGISWSLLSSGTISTLQSIVAHNDTTLIAAGTNGTLVKTSNSGLTWGPLISGISTSIQHISLLPNGNGRIVGANGVIRLSSIQLPVKLIDFSVNRIANNDAIIRWQSAQEINVCTFYIQQSYCGDSWFNIQSVPASINSFKTLSYSHIERNLPNKTIYYRLFIQDCDGTSEYSDVVVLHPNNQNSKFIFYPNPITDNRLYFLQQDINLEPITFQIIDDSGRFIETVTITTDERSILIPQTESKFVILLNTLSGESHKIIIRPN